VNINCSDIILASKINCFIKQQIYQSQLAPTQILQLLSKNQSNRNDLANMILFTAFKTWNDIGKPDKFDFAEIGAGEGDLTREFIKIVENFKEQEQNPDLKKFGESINFSVLDLECMAPKTQDLVDNGAIKFIPFDAKKDEFTQRYNFVANNELFDTQPFELLKVEDGKAYILKISEIDGKYHPKFEEVDQKDYSFLKELFNLDEKDGLYPIHIGHFLLTHKLNKSCDAFFASDYFDINPEPESFIRFYSKKFKDINPNLVIQFENVNIVDFMNFLRENYVDGFDVTYSPIINKDYLEKFNLKFLRFGNKDTDLAILKYNGDFDKIFSIDKDSKMWLDSSSYLRTCIDLFGFDKEFFKEDEKSLPINFKKNKVPFKEYYLKDLKFLKFLHTHQIIDINDYDCSRHCIFDFIKKDGEESKKFVEFFIENMNNISSIKYQGKSVLEHLQDSSHIDLQEKIIKKIKDEFSNALNQDEHLNLLLKENCKKELQFLLQQHAKSPFIAEKFLDKIKEYIGSSPDLSVKGAQASGVKQDSSIHKVS